MRVLHVTQPTDGGVALHVKRLSVFQRENGHNVAVACPGGDLPLDLAEALSLIHI